ncbi:ATP-binding protein [Sphingomonas gellani]|uniref:ATP-binding protein n=1 Tax=Sphingomonas gellani TaxID=1166340 RepID=UPI001FCD9F7A|nr:ATP-binding protein [Sphingomonas gellani]
MQLIGLLVGALVAAQLVTLLLTLVLPPAPPRKYALADIAASLRQQGSGDDRFDRVIQSGPPDLSARGWFVSESSRGKLAGLLHAPVRQVALGFYTQLPVGGAVDPVATPERLPGDAERMRGGQFSAETDDAVTLEAVVWSVEAERPRLIRAALFQQGPGGPPGGGFPGGGPPGGGFPGAGLPGGGFPQSLPQPPPTLPRQAPPQLPSTQPQPQAQPQALAPTAQPPASMQPGSPGAVLAPGTSPQPPLRSALPPGVGLPQLTAPGIGGALPRTPESSSLPPPRRPEPQPQDTAPLAAASNPAPSVPPAVPTTPAPTTGAERIAPPQDADGTSDAVEGVAPPPAGRPVPIVRPTTGLFGLAPAPFVEGDFVAGLQLPDGRWAVVSPRAEGFPNAWQRRVALWFLLSLLAVAPIAWIFMRRIVGPLNEFAHAADVLGRDPGAAVLPLDGPAEIGRAAHAFNQMQSRLRSFVDDRTAMIGAISHDLRTPLTRLRFRIEDVPEDQQDGLRGEVAEMEEMITSVIAFMRDASTPAARERRDLAEIVDEVVEDATLLGDVHADRVESAVVDVDPLGIRRVLDNLLTNAMKYGGGHTRVALRVENACAIAEIVDDGPGLPDAELERVFEPFYRTEAARRSGREGSGLGLAVCRSIARAHGGDVALFRAPNGFTARVTLPLAFPNDCRVG